jgi:sulfatase modifying factor 1
VLVEDRGLCIDRYEASQGPGGVAVSAAGVLPWERVTWYEADRACGLAGKRLCRAREWIAACGGPLRYDYPYGSEYQDGACNTPSVITPRTPRLEPTGSYPACEGGFSGLFDMQGNVSEWSAERTFAEDAGERAGFVGQGYIRHSASERCDEQSFDYNTDSPVPGIGFRCCLSVDT